MKLDLAQLLNPYDLIFLLVILVSFIFGVKNGLIKSLLNLIKWIVIFYFIKNCFDVLRPFFDQYILNQTLSDILIFFFTLITAYILISFINRMIIGILQPRKSLFIDMSFGGVLGILRGYIIFILIIFFINSNFSSNLIPEIIKSGTFQEIVNYGVDLLDQMPRNINEI